MGLAGVNEFNRTLARESFRENSQCLYLSRAREAIVPKNPLALAMGSFSGSVFAGIMNVTGNRRQP